MPVDDRELDHYEDADLGEISGSNLHDSNRPDTIKLDNMNQKRSVTNLAHLDQKVAEQTISSVRSG